MNNSNALSAAAAAAVVEAWMTDGEDSSSERHGSVANRQLPT